MIATREMRKAKVNNHVVLKNLSLSFKPSSNNKSSKHAPRCRRFLFLWDSFKKFPNMLQLKT